MEWLAWPAGILGASMAMPQVFMVVRGKTNGVAPATWAASFAVTAAWAVWGFKESNLALTATNVLAAGASLAVVVTLVFFSAVPLRRYARGPPVFSFAS